MSETEGKKALYIAHGFGSPLIHADGNEALVRGNRRGEMFVVDPVDAWVDGGFAFQCSNVARETAEVLGHTSFSDTAPAWILDVPDGTTAKPLEIIMNQGGTVAGGPITALLTLESGKIRYASGGQTFTPQNLRTDEPKVAACSFYADATGALVAAANADDNTIWGAILDEDVATGPRPDIGINLTIRNFVMPLLVGPCSLLMYAYAATTAPSWHYSIKWAEMPTVFMK